MSFTAKFPGRCAACPDPIEVGDTVRYAEVGVSPLIHVACEDDYASHGYERVAEKADPPLCPDCFTTHVGECL